MPPRYCTLPFPQALLAEFQKVEADLGRQRNEHWGPRTIDLDLLLYDDLTLADPDLVVPHPRMAWRRFVLEPAAEVAPEMLHPGTGWTIARLLDHLNQTPWYLAIAGPIGVGKSLSGRRNRGKKRCPAAGRAIRPLPAGSLLPQSV